MKPVIARPKRTVRLFVAIALALLALSTLGSLAQPGRVAAGELGLEMRDAYDFGHLRVGEERTMPVPIFNRGNAPIWIARTGMADPSINGGSEGISWMVGPWRAQGCSSQWLQPGAVCNIQVTVRGNYNGRHQAAVAIRYYAQPPRNEQEYRNYHAEGTFVVMFVTGGKIGFQDKELNVGAALVGESTRGEIWVTNTSDDMYFVKDFDITGGGIFGGDGGFDFTGGSDLERYLDYQCRGRPYPNNGQFSDPNRGWRLNPGGSCKVVVKFTPDDDGQTKRKLKVTLTSSREETIEVPLIGFGVKNDGKQGHATLYPVDGLDFGAQEVGTTSRVRRGLIVNDGQGTLIIDGYNPYDPFAFEDDCQGYIKPGQSCLYEFRFAPKEPGNYNVSFDIILKNADNGRSVEFPLRGLGVAPTPSPSPSPSPPPSPSASPSPSPSPSASPSPSSSPSPSASPSPSPVSWPQPPTNLRLVRTSCQGTTARVELAWDAPSTGPSTGYQIYRSTGAVWTAVGQATGTTFADGATVSANAPACGGHYYYMVRTMDGVRTSDNSNEVEVWP